MRAFSLYPQTTMQDMLKNVYTHLTFNTIIPNFGTYDRIAPKVSAGRALALAKLFRPI